MRLRASPLRSRAGRALPLGRAVLFPWLAVLSVAPVETVLATPLQVRVVMMSESGGPQSAALSGLKLVAVPVDPERAERRDFEVGSSLRTIDLPTGRWRLAVSGPAVWVEDKLVDIRPGGQEVALRGWRAGQVVARLTGPRQPMDASRLRVAFRPSPAASARSGAAPLPDQGLGACHAKATRIECTFPLGLLDLRASAEGFAPVYRWSVAVRPGATTDLGSMRLDPGASVSGFVVDQGDEPRPGVRVALLTPEGDAVTRKAGEGNLEPMEASSDGRGFFQITGLAAGQYELMAVSHDKKTASTVVQTEAEAEVRLDDALILSDPAPVDVNVEPPTHPSGASWTIVFQNLDRSPSDTSVRLAVPEGGSLHLDSLASGGYLLLLEVDDNRYHAEQVEVRPPATRVDVRLDLVRLRGRVQLGAKPLAASLVFGGKHGLASVELRSSEEGAFEGYLPNAGPWPVDVDAKSPPVRRSLTGVELEDPQDGVYGARIELPNTQIVGDVVDEMRDPVVPAIVNVKPLGSEDSLFQTMVDPKGHFELWGLPEEPLLVAASAHGDLEADPQFVTPSSGDSPSNVQLVLRPQKRLKARVLRRTTGEPVAGAFVKVTPLGQLPTMLSPLSWSEADGRFEALLPPGTQAVDVTLGSASDSIQMTRIDPVKDSETILSLEPGGGLLLLDYPERETGQSRQLILFHGGAAESAIALHRIASRSEPGGAGKGLATQEGEHRRIALKSLAPGDYVACLLPAAPPSLEQRPLSRAECAAGTLMPGGELLLVLPE